MMARLSRPIRQRIFLAERSTENLNFVYRWRRGLLSVVDLALLACAAIVGVSMLKIYKGTGSSSVIVKTKATLPPVSTEATSIPPTPSLEPPEIPGEHVQDPHLIHHPQDPRIAGMTDSTDEFTGSPGNPSVTYQVVGASSSKATTYHIVYAAIDATTKQPVSIDTWAKWMAQSERASVLAHDLTRVIASSGYEGLFFETPGVSPHNAHLKQFRFCLINAPRLAEFATSQASSSAFQEHLDACADPDACQFPNLGGDALLVVPQQHADTGDVTTYSHLAAFLRRAPSEQIAAVWKKVASTWLDVLAKRDSRSPVWLSTEGSGVPWLHFRFDDRPKYYHDDDFRNQQ